MLASECWREAWLSSPNVVKDRQGRKTAERTWCTCLIVDVVGLKTAYQTRYRAVVVTGCRTGEDVSARVLCVCLPSTHIDIRTRLPWYAALDWLILCFIIIIIICMCCGVFSVKLSLCRLKVYWLKVNHSGADGKWHRFTTTTTSAFGSELFLWRSLQLRPCNPLPLPEGLPKNFWGLHFWTLEWDFLQAWKCPLVTQPTLSKHWKKVVWMVESILAYNYRVTVGVQDPSPARFTLPDRNWSIL